MKTCPTWYYEINKMKKKKSLDVRTVGIAYL